MESHDVGYILEDFQVIDFHFLRAFVSSFIRLIKFRKVFKDIQVKFHKVMQFIMEMHDFISNPWRSQTIKNMVMHLVCKNYQTAGKFLNYVIYSDHDFS